jgi:hypothetical protein
MSDVVISGLFALVGVAIGSFATYLATRDARRMQNLERLVCKLADQVASYWALEKLYSEELARATHQNQKTVLQDFRDTVQSDKLVRPVMTANEAEDIKQRYEQ